MNTDTTGYKVLQAIKQTREVKEEGTASDGVQYRSLSEGQSEGNANPGLSFFINNDGEHGTFNDHVTGESGSLYKLAESLGVELPEASKPYTPPKPKIESIETYAEDHGTTKEVLMNAGWSQVVKGGRVALEIPTSGGTRYRFLTGDGPKFTAYGYKKCWYGLNEAMGISNKNNDSGIILCNGEPSTVVGQSYGLPTFTIPGGESKSIPEDLTKELATMYGKEGKIYIALDSDDAGLKGAVVAYNTLKEEGFTNVETINLGGFSGFDLADFCKDNPTSTFEQLIKKPSINLEIANKARLHNKGSKDPQVYKTYKMLLSLVNEFENKKQAKSTSREIGVYELATRHFLADNGNAHIVTESGNRHFDGKVWVDLDERKYKNEIYDYMNKLAYLKQIRSKHVNEVLSMCNNQTFTSDERFDKKEQLITFNNGTYDLDSHNLRDFSKDDYITSRLDYDFNPDATCPNWRKFVSEIMTKDEADFMQEFIGYCLTRSVKYQVMPWLVGRPGTGKSTFTETIGKLLGNMSTDLSLGEIGKNRFALHAILGKTLIFSSESGDGSGVFKETELINKIITGDAVTLEKKYGGRINNYRPFSKVIWSMNTPPVISDPNNGIFRRLRYIKIDKAIPPEKMDQGLMAKLEAEFEGIIQWAIEGLKRLDKRGKMLTPKTVIDNVEEYKNDNDKVGSFISELTTVGDGLNVPQSTLYKLYIKWCDANGYYKESSRKFASKLLIRNGITKKKSGVVKIYGLEIDVIKETAMFFGGKLPEETTEVKEVEDVDVVDTTQQESYDDLFGPA